MKQLFLLGFSLFFTQNLLAQTREDAPNFYRSAISSDFNAATDGKNALLALSAKQLFGIGANRRFKIGYGLRINHNFGSKTTFLTAPAILTTGRTGPIVFFDGTKIGANIDTLQSSSFTVTSINIPLYLEYAITNRLDVGFNIDLTGLSFGSAAYNYQSVHATAANQGAVKGNATSPNLLLIGDNDLGSLSSELVVRYHLNNKLAFNAGLCFAFAEFTTDRKLYLDNDRFREKQLMGMVGLSYRLH
ncbi:MAG: hypothetical protein RI894_251 [Bacteroidota bacterium]|jgi:hypothetical protein